MTGRQETKPVRIANAIPIKVGAFGEQGSGKSTSMALLAVALSQEVYGGAPVYVTDTEPGWQFLKTQIFDVEGVELIQRTTPTFKAMTENIREAQSLGACVWNVDTLTIIWSELMDSFQGDLGYIPIEMWGDIRREWKYYVKQFMNSEMSCIACGRIANVMEDVQDENIPEKTKLVKIGTKLKAGGGESFGYEPHLLIEMSLERKAKHSAGSKHEGEGRMVHRADIIKDRTWALNGKVLRWSDKPSYEKSGYRAVWKSIKPHWDKIQATGAHVKLQEGSSESLSGGPKNSRTVRLEVVQRVEATLTKYFPLVDPTSKKAKTDMIRAFFNTYSWKDVVNKTAIERLEQVTVQRDGKPSMLDTACKRRLDAMIVAERGDPAV